MVQDWIKKIKAERLAKLTTPEEDVESQTERNFLEDKISRPPAVNESSRNNLLVDEETVRKQDVSIIFQPNLKIEMPSSATFTVNVEKLKIDVSLDDKLKQSKTKDN